MLKSNREDQPVNQMLDPTLVPISPEPTLKLLKHLTRRPLKSNDLKLVDQETGVDS